MSKVDIYEAVRVFGRAYSSHRNGSPRHCGATHAGVSAVVEYVEEQGKQLSVFHDLIGWRTPNFLYETNDRQTAIGWACNGGALPIFSDDPHTKLATQPPTTTNVQEGVG